MFVRVCLFALHDVTAPLGSYCGEVIFYGFVTRAYISHIQLTHIKAFAAAKDGKQELSGWRFFEKKNPLIHHSFNYGRTFFPREEQRKRIASKRKRKISRVKCPVILMCRVHCQSMAFFLLCKILCRIFVRVCWGGNVVGSSVSQEFGKQGTCSVFTLSRTRKKWENPVALVYT